MDEMRASAAERDPNIELKGRVGGAFGLALGGFGLLFFGGGTLFVIYRVWIAPPASVPK
jgi:hypothetical protein